MTYVYTRNDIDTYSSADIGTSVNRYIYSAPKSDYMGKEFVLVEINNNNKNNKKSDITDRKRKKNGGKSTFLFKTACTRRMRTAWESGGPRATIV